MGQQVAIRLSSLEHFVYCPRQCGLIDVEGQWEDNRHIVRGQRQHRRVDSGARTERAGVITLRSIPLWSEHYGLSGRADAVEIAGDGELVPVEYKSGTRHGDAADVQLCAQAFCLEEMFGLPVTHGALWFGASRRRMQVVVTEALRERTTTIISSVREMVASGTLPDAPNDARCHECQLRNRCLPEITGSDDRSGRLAADLFEDQP